MAAQQNPDVAVPHAEYQSEDEDSTVSYDDDQFPDWDDPLVVLRANPSLKVEDWVPRDASGWEHYVPTFTRPGYDDDIEVTGDGLMERPRRGAPRSRMRAALLPTDPPATQYARRFGIFPNRKFNENYEARSLLSPIPTSKEDPPPDGSEFQWEFEESFQATCFEYFTTKELSDLGAFDPNLMIQGPDLQGNLHELLTRDNWSQESFDIDTDDDNFSLTFWYNLNGEKKPWDVQQNDELWNALQPALQLASKVLLSEHPFWKAITSIYHMRPVPKEKDGRTQQEKADPRYRPYVSTWYDIDRDKMYPAAKSLMDQKFDSTAATLEVLRRLLKFSISRSDRIASASTICGWNEHNRSIRIIVDSSNIWPLLVPEYSVSEKTSVSFYVAKLILHELAHAARNALDYYLIFPDILEKPPWTPPSGTAFDERIRNDLGSLCFEALTLPPMERFFQDFPQMEEGKAFELQLFGFDVTAAPSPAEGRKNDHFQPITSAISWPWKHPRIHVQNQKSVDAGEYNDFTRTSYKTYLLDPPASAYDLYTPLPVKLFSKYLQHSWWDNDFIKFGHQGLKIPTHSTDRSSPLKTTARPNVSLESFEAYLTPVIRSRIALAFITVYAMPRLYEHGQLAILSYLSLFTQDVAAARIMRNRLHYEKRTWPERLRGIRELSVKSTQSFEAVWEDLTQKLQHPLSQNTAAEVLDVVVKIRELLTNLIELNRLLGIEIQYSQALAAMYILKTPEARIKIHRRYMSFLRENLVQMRDHIVSTFKKVAPKHEQDGGLVWKTIAAPWEARFIYMIETNPAAVNGAAQQAAYKAIKSLTNIRNYTLQTCGDLLITSNHMENILPVLSDQYIDFPIATAPTGLFPGVPIATQMMGLSKIVEKRAIYEAIRLKNPILNQIVGQWIKILQTHIGLSERAQDFLNAVNEGRDQERDRQRIKNDIRSLTIVIFEVKRREVDPARPGYDGRHPRDLWVDSIRGQLTLLVGDDEDYRAWLRQICIEEQDGEEFDTIMRMMNKRPGSREPAPQGSASHQNA